MAPKRLNLRSLVDNVTASARNRLLHVRPLVIKDFDFSGAFGSFISWGGESSDRFLCVSLLYRAVNFSTLLLRSSDREIAGGPAELPTYSDIWLQRPAFQWKLIQSGIYKQNFNLWKDRGPLEVMVEGGGEKFHRADRNVAQQLMFKRFQDFGLLTSGSFEEGSLKLAKRISRVLSAPELHPGPRPC